MDHALPVVVSDKVDSDTEVSISSWSADTMQVGLRVFGEVEVDHHVHRLNVYTSGEEICAIQTSKLFEIAHLFYFFVNFIWRT